MSVHIEIDKLKLAEFCQRNHIHQLALFGSVLRDDFGAESDVMGFLLPIIAYE